MPRYLLTVTGLTVTRPWDVGPVTFHDEASARDLINRATERVGTPGRETLDDITDALQRGAVASVTAPDLEAADTLIAAAVDVLLVFKDTAPTRVRTTTFGMPGDVAHVVQHYLELDTLRAGFRHAGHYIGWTFTDDEAHRWTTSPVFLRSSPEPLAAQPHA